MKNLTTVAVFALVGSFGSPREAASQPMPRSQPEAQGVSSSAVLAFVQEAEKKIDALHSFMLVRHGHVVAEGWWSPYNAETPHALYSLSKSFTSTAVGLAIAEGKLSLDDEVLKFFPDDAPAEPSKNLKAMRVSDCCGCRRAIRPSRPDARGGLDQEVPGAARAAQAGHAFPLQHVGDVHALGDRPESDGHDRARLPRAAPLRAARHRAPNVGNEPARRQTGGYGLSIRTEDIARFGQLYLQKGKWHGKQLVPEAWVDAATARQTSNGSNPKSDWDRLRLPVLACRHGAYRGDGAFGQYLHRPARAGRRNRHHKRGQGHAVGDESRLGSAPARH